MKPKVHRTKFCTSLVLHSEDCSYFWTKTFICHLMEEHDNWNLLTPGRLAPVEVVGWDRHWGEGGKWKIPLSVLSSLLLTGTVRLKLTCCLKYPTGVFRQKSSLVWNDSSRFSLQPESFEAEITIESHSLLSLTHKWLQVVQGCEGSGRGRRRRC